MAANAHHLTSHINEAHLENYDFLAGHGMAKWEILQILGITEHNLDQLLYRREQKRKEAVTHG